MTPFARRVALIAAGGLVVRLVLIAVTDGSTFDITNYQRTLDGVRAGGFDAYALVTRVEWPYGPGWFPWLLSAGELNHVISFSAAVRLGPALCDVAITVLVADLLGRFGRDERTRLIGAAVVAFGPLSVIGSGWFGQLDTPAALASLLALWVWVRCERRAVWVGLLLALAASIKTVPLLLVLPFVAASRSRREGTTVAAVAVGGALLALSPFYAQTPSQVSALGSYHGIPAVGGLSLILQPTFAAKLLAGDPQPVGDFLAFLRDDATTFVLMPALLALAVLLWRRPAIDVLTGICLTWLVVYVFGVNLSVTYLGWAVPFFLVRGHWRGVLAVQLAVTPLLLLLTDAYDPPLAVIYVIYTAVMAGLWFYGVALLAWLASKGVPVAVADSPGSTAVS